MLNKSKDAMEKWTGFDKAIDRWLDERHALVLQLVDFASHQEELSEDDAEVREKIESFKTLLIDYISAGHFEIYDRLKEEGKEFGDSVEAGWYAAIDRSTAKALEFHDTYDTADTSLDDLVGALSALGETLEERFEIEDYMIEVLHNAHQDRFERAAS